MRTSLSRLRRAPAPHYAEPVRVRDVRLLDTAPEASGLRGGRYVFGVDRCADGDTVVCLRENDDGTFDLIHLTEWTS